MVGIRNSAPVTMPRPAMIDRTQASALQAACGAKPEVCSAQVAPCSASADSMRCKMMPTMTIRISASPTAFSSTARKAGVNICASALTAASIIERRGKALRPRGQDRDQATRDSVSLSSASVSAGTRLTSSSASGAGTSAQAMAL